MGNMSADNKKKRRRRIGRIGGAAAAIALVAGGIIWGTIGGKDDSTSGDYGHRWGQRTDAEVYRANVDAFVYLDATVDATPDGG